MATASPSSAPESRGQLSPTTALVAVAMVGVGLSLYAAVLAGAVPTPDRDVATPTLTRVNDALSPAGVARPDRISDAAGAGPTGYRTRVTLSIEDHRWIVGPLAPQHADRASRRVAVRAEPGRVRTGTLRVAVWR